jgi:hypothetical protein
MPSIRVLLTYILPRAIGSFHEPTPGSLTGHQDLMDGIYDTKSFSIEYNRHHNNDDLTFVQLEDMPGGTSSRSENNVEGRTGKETYGRCLV